MNDSSRPPLTLDQVTLSRAGFRLSPVSFRVNSGECLFLRGVNGSGKSSLLAAIAGLVDIDGGTILHGAGLWAGPETAIEPWRRPCSILLQDHGLWPHLSIREQCLLVANGAADTLDGLSTDLEIRQLLDRRPTELSGGEAQRCALARTLIRRAPVVLLDEPFSAQHERGVERVEAAIDRLLGNGCAVVVAGHRSPDGASEYELN